MTTLSPTRLRRMFNVRSERLLRSIFGEHFRTWIALYVKAYGGQISPDRMNELYARWYAMHRKIIERANDDDAAPGIHLV